MVFSRLLLFVVNVSQKILKFQYQLFKNSRRQGFCAIARPQFRVINCGELRFVTLVSGCSTSDIA